MPLLIALVWIQVIYVTMVYGPIAAFLVEYFRAKVRYTSLSIPYHFGNGWFGGLLPLLFTGLVGATFPEGSKSYVPFLTNFMGLPIKTEHLTAAVQPIQRSEREHLSRPRIHDHRRPHDRDHRHAVPT